MGLDQSGIILRPLAYRKRPFFGRKLEIDKDFCSLLFTVRTWLLVNGSDPYTVSVIYNSSILLNIALKIISSPLATHKEQKVTYYRHCCVRIVSITVTGVWVVVMIVNRVCQKKLFSSLKKNSFWAKSKRCCPQIILFLQKMALKNECPDFSSVS